MSDSPHASPNDAAIDSATPLASTTTPTSGSPWRWDATWILVIVAVVAGRIFALQPLQENRHSPFMSANDRSRWATIRALGDDGTYAIDHLTVERGSVWNTIDKVVHVGEDGRLHEYSSKPTLLPTLYAYLYRAIRLTTGWSLDHQPFSVARTLLLLVNVLPLAVLLGAVATLARKRGMSAWTRAILVAGLGLGTSLGTFAVTLNNHLPAAVSVGIVILSWWLCATKDDPKRTGADESSRDASVGKRSHWWFAIGGLFAAFAAANELPALSFLCLAAFAFLLVDWRKTLLIFLPAAGIVACASFATNWQAHHSWRPPYAHRSDGAVLLQLPAEAADAAARGELSAETRRVLNDGGVMVSSRWSLNPGTTPVPEGTRRWVLTDLGSDQRWALVQPTSESQIDVREWDNWYEYDWSYWSQPRESRSRVDQGEESRARYAWHMLLGHHGLISLSPLLALAVAGVVLGLRPGQPRIWQAFTIAVLLLTVVVFGFYLSRPLIDRNYGGQTSYLRWMLWFTPMWILLAMDPIERLAKRAAGRAVVLTLLGMSIASAAYAQANPWIHPWLYTWLGGE
ncbi:MAG: hypothetical protein KDA83_02990 [Planctomycetales bacterium]|nr:hypothetical protein [Planctomycetales bacterium]